MCPAVLWRGELPGPSPPEPWPSRVDAFVRACALYAGEQERLLGDVVEAFSKKSPGS